MDNFVTWITIILGVIGIISGVFAFFTRMTQPNNQQDKEIGLIKKDIKTHKECISKIENKVDSLDIKIDKIMTNHLPHIENAIVELRGSIDRISDRIK
jgi:peptidoglycan hydrolase CwlO-like protein